MIIPDKFYQPLKWIAIAGMPAVFTLWSTLASVWGLPYGTQVGATIGAIGLFLAAVLGVSNANYSKGEGNE